jgi:dienelactone hydrolase
MGFPDTMRETASIPLDDGTHLEAELSWPEDAEAVCLVVGPLGWSRHDDKARALAEALNDNGIGSCLVDCLTREEEEVDFITGHVRGNAGLVADRFLGAVRWLVEHGETAHLPLLGLSSGAAAQSLLIAAGRGSDRFAALVAYDGRLDAGSPLLGEVRTPTLLIVKGDDPELIELNRRVFDALTGKKDFMIIPAAASAAGLAADVIRVAQVASLFFLDVLDPLGVATGSRSRVRRASAPQSYYPFDEL